MKTDPLKVLYTQNVPPSCFDPETGTFVVSKIEADTINNLRAGIDNGSINAVILVGHLVAAGWRIYTTRVVEFSSSVKPTSHQKSAELLQAAGRIVQKLPNGSIAPGQQA